MLEQSINNAVKGYLQAIYTKDTDQKVTTNIVVHVVSLDINNGDCLVTECIEGHREHLMGIAESILDDALYAPASVLGDAPEFDFIRLN